MLKARGGGQTRMTAVKRTRTSIQNCLCLLFALLLPGCVKNEVPFNAQQQAVYEAMQAWSRGCEQRDTKALWDLLSPDAQTFYRMELTGPGGVRATVKMEKAALAPGSMISDELRQKKEAFLKTMPPEPEKMTPQQYHAWRLQAELTPENIANQSRLFSRENIESIELAGDRGTVTLKHGDPKQYSWFRHDGVWKFDVTPSMLRALEEARNTSR